MQQDSLNVINYVINKIRTEVGNLFYFILSGVSVFRHHFQFEK